MDKVRKLRRYNRKDYSQLVEFPVEIVGRDGVVRRYSFEESVRLYQRRIASADLRYDDGDVVQAEVKHCRQRIEQLRRSYFVRFGWSAIQVVDTPEAMASGLAGEVAAFIRRSFESVDFEPDAIEFSFVEDGRHHQVYFVRPPIRDERGPREGYVLYLFRFAPSGDCPSRSAFFELLRLLQGVRRGGDGVESLVAFHHTADCGLVLTGNPSDAGVASGEVEQREIDEELVQIQFIDDEDREGDALHEGMVALRRGDRQGALEKFVLAYERNHYRRAAYVGAAVVADQIGAHTEAETAGLMGTRYFPNDPLLHYQLAVALLRRGACVPARAALARVRTLSGDSHAVDVLDALVDLRAGRVRQASRRLALARRSAPVDDPDLLGAIRTVRAQLAARRILLAGCAGNMLGGIVLALLLSRWMLLLALFGVLLWPATHAAWKRQYQRLLGAPGSRGLRLANPPELRAAVGMAEVPQ